MSRPAGWVILLLGAAVAGIGYLGFTGYPASLSIPYLQKLLPFIVEGWGEQRDLYASIFESKLGVFVRGHPMEMMGGYGLIGLFLLLSRGYRDAGWEHCLLVLWYGIFIPILFYLGLMIGQGGIDLFHFFGGGESSVGFVDNLRTNFIGTFLRWLAGVVIGVPVMLFGLVVALVLRAAVYVVPPLYILFVLFALPSIAFVILRFLVWLPILAYHYVHYLSVPHPAESAYRAGVAEHLPIPELARNVADAMYRYDLKDYNAFPPAWKLKNCQKRIEAFDALLKAQAGFMEGRSAAWQKEEERFMEELIKNLRLRSQLREYG